jgi:SagB-type dehydrogenase family enzyme
LIEYHEATKHSPASVRADHFQLDWANQPRSFKVYTAVEPIALTLAFKPSSMPPLSAIAGGSAALEESSVSPTSAIAGGLMDGERTESPRPLDRELLARLCYFSNGITRVIKRAGGSMPFRAAACTGALYHIELYLVCGDLPDLGAGVYHYAAHDNSLGVLRRGDFRAVLVTATGAEPSVAAAPVSLVCTSTYWRNAWKYRARAYRHVFWDSGTVVANLLSVAAANGVAARVVLGFADSSVNQLLGVDPAEEAAVCIVTLNGNQPPPAQALPQSTIRSPAEALPQSTIRSPVEALPQSTIRWPAEPLPQSTIPSPAAASSTPEVPPLNLPTQPLSPTRVDYPEIIAAHAASSLDSSEAAAAWRTPAPTQLASVAPDPPSDAASVAPNPPPGGEEPPPAPPDPPSDTASEASKRSSAEAATRAATSSAADPRDSSIEAVILRRGSSRKFAREPIGRPQLLDMLVAATVPLASDFGGHGALTQPYLIVNAVDGLSPGAYVFDRQTRSLELLKDGDFRREAAFLGLDQELAGDAAVNAYWLADLATITDRSGQRGYRAAQLEAAIEGGKLYLAAYALGLGATGLTFYDDQVTRFFEPHAAGKAVMFLVAVGRPARRA